MVNDHYLIQLQNTYRTGERDKIKEVISVVLKNAPNNSQALLMCVKVATKMGEVTLASKVIDCLVASNPQNKETPLIKASLLAELGQINTALNYIMTQSDVSSPDIQHFIGTVKAQTGDVEGALTHFRQVLKTWSTAGQTWNTLASLKTFTIDDPDLVSLALASKKVHQSHPLSQATFQYAMGKAKHDLGEYQLAAKYYQQGAKFMDSQGKYDADSESRLVDSLVRSFSQISLDELAGNIVTPEFTPIFVLGWPRSGTTLIERVISSHSQVMAGGEVGFMQKLAMDLKGISIQHARRFEEQFVQPQDAWQSLAKLYAYLVKEQFGQSGTIVDKTLGNSRYLGLVAKIFPNAPKIWVRRDPMDTALSCFRTFFSGPMDWSWSMENIAQHFANEDRLFNHWCEVFKGEILIVPYEEYVASPEKWTKKILNHCNLSDEKTFQNYHLNKQATTSSSVGQVRKEVYRSSTGIAKHYIAMMQPFAHSYQALSE